MLVRFDPRDHGRNLAFVADHKRGSLNPQEFPAVHALFLQHAEPFGYRLVLVRHEEKGKAEFFFELFQN
jgi:hypothetical protein